MGNWVPTTSRLRTDRLELSLTRQQHQSISECRPSVLAGPGLNCIMYRIRRWHLPDAKMSHFVLSSYEKQSDIESQVFFRPGRDSWYEIRSATEAQRFSNMARPCLELVYWVFNLF